MAAFDYNKLINRHSGLVIILAAVGYNLSIEHLSGRGYSAASTLVYRGVIGCAALWALARLQGVSIWPQAHRTQVARFLNSGIAILLTFEAFHRLAGTTVSVVQRLDIPFAVLLAVLAGQRARDGKFWLSLLAIGVVLSSFLFAGRIDEDPVGLGLAIIAVAQTSLAYLLGKKSVALENNLTILNASNLGCLFVGLAVCAVRGELSPLHWPDLWLFGLSALTQFVLNYMMVLMFRKHDVARARRPYLVASLVIMALEMLTEHKWFAPLHIAFVLVVVGAVYLITLTDPAHLLQRVRQRLGWRSESPEELITIT